MPRSSAKKSTPESLIKIVNDGIVNCLRDYPHGTDALLKASLYCVGSGGHRWRPILFLRIWEKLNAAKSYSPILTVACAIEYLHTASIILDDLPAMDNGLMRRGKKTCHLEFSEAQAILAACWLCDVAQHYIHKVQLQTSIKTALDLEDALRMTKNKLMQGQIRDLQQEAGSEKEILKTYQLKSGVFYGFAASAPARILGLGKLAEHLEKFGNYLGIAYQISDDIADQTASVTQLGKDVHKDDSKPTLPQKCGMKRAIALRHAYYEKAIKELKHLPGNIDELVDLTKKIICFD